MEKSTHTRKIEATFVFRIFRIKKQKNKKQKRLQLIREQYLGSEERHMCVQNAGEYIMQKGRTSDYNAL